MKTIGKYQKKSLIAIFIAALLLSGCGQKSNSSTPQPQAMQAEQESDKIPDQLKDIEGSIEKIIKDLDSSSESAKEEKQTQGEQQGQQAQSGQQGQQAQSSQQGQQGQGSQQAQTTTQQDPWEKTKASINTLHYQWNSYMPMAVNKNASKTLLDNFGKALNNLTDNLMTKNKQNSLIAANHLYSYIPDIYSLYKTETSPEIKRIRYYIRNITIYATIGGWNQADTDMASLESSWGLYKNMIPKEVQENSSKLDLSIYELEKVVKEKNQPLTDIKGRVALSNVESLEKAIEEKSKQSK